MSVLCFPLLHYIVSLVYSLLLRAKRSVNGPSIEQFIWGFGIGWNWCVSAEHNRQRTVSVSRAFKSSFLHTRDDNAVIILYVLTWTCLKNSQIPCIEVHCHWKPIQLRLAHQISFSSAPNVIEWRRRMNGLQLHWSATRHHCLPLWRELDLYFWQVVHFSIMPMFITTQKTAVRSRRCFFSNPRCNACSCRKISGWSDVCMMILLPLSKILYPNFIPEIPVDPKLGNRNDQMAIQSSLGLSALSR